MNDITLNDINLNEMVYYFLKPSDKTPHLRSKVLDMGEDHRGKELVILEGVGEVPIYHIKKIEAFDAIDYGRGNKDISVNEPAALLAFEAERKSFNKPVQSTR